MSREGLLAGIIDVVESVDVVGRAVGRVDVAGRVDVVGSEELMSRAALASRVELTLRS